MAGKAYPELNGHADRTLREASCVSGVEQLIVDAVT